jgi:hypothetical protein
VDIAFGTVSSTWVPQINGPVANVAIKIHIALEPNWVFAIESSNVWVVVSGAVIGQASLLAGFLTGMACAALAYVLH